MFEVSGEQEDNTRKVLGKLGKKQESTEKILGTLQKILEKYRKSTVKLAGK